jgi:AmmeMemoRadiSam system protein A
MRSAEPALALSARHRDILLEVALQSIESGLREGRPLEPDPRDYDAPLREPRASFVTLRRQGELRGCIGCLEAREALVASVAGNAWSSAFRDPRFDELSGEELSGIEIRVSVLSPSERVEVASEEELLRSLRPRIDGLVLRDGALEATFLPSVWESLADPRAFLRELRRKAGMSPGGWSKTLEVERYTTEEWGRRLD